MSELARLIEHSLGERSVRQAAKDAGIPAWQLYDILRGKSGRPRPDTLRAIADGLKIPYNLLAVAAYEDTRIPA